jgi:acyl-[acyl-carrier-protein] desaturase
VAETIRDGVYRAYLDFVETAEKKRRWNIFDDVPWDALDPAKIAEHSAQSIEIFCSEELYVPDYSAKGLELVRPSFGMTWFQISWANEEARHGLVFREYLTRSGLRSEAQFAVLEAEIFAHEWQLPFPTARQMACYGAIQEGATYVAYKAQREMARAAEDPVLSAIFHLVGRDEAAHGGFYRALIGLELLEDRAGTVADLAHVLAEFKMPGDGLIANYRERLQLSGAGISARNFVEHVIWPLLTMLNIGRQEFKLALRGQSAIAPTPLEEPAMLGK